MQLQLDNKSKNINLSHNVASRNFVKWNYDFLLKLILQNLLIEYISIRIGLWQNRLVDVLVNESYQIVE